MTMERNVTASVDDLGTGAVVLARKRTELRRDGDVEMVGASRSSNVDNRLSNIIPTYTYLCEVGKVTRRPEGGSADGGGGERR